MTKSSQNFRVWHPVMGETSCRCSILLRNVIVGSKRSNLLALRPVYAGDPLIVTKSGIGPFSKGRAPRDETLVVPHLTFERSLKEPHRAAVPCLKPRAFVEIPVASGGISLSLSSSMESPHSLMVCMDPSRWS